MSKKTTKVSPAKKPSKIKPKAVIKELNGYIGSATFRANHPTRSCLDGFNLYMLAAFKKAIEEQMKLEKAAIAKKKARDAKKLEKKNGN